MYSTDNGPHYNAWPDAGTTPFRSEKNSNWEGAYRVPAFVRWPGNFTAGKTLNGLVAHEDWLVTFLTAAGMPDVKERLMKGDDLRRQEIPALIRMATTMLDYLSGKAKDSPRNEFWYVSDDGQVVAARWQDWKVVFLENRGEAFGVWREPYRRTAGAAAVQPAPRSVREGRPQLEHLQRLVPRPGFRPACRSRLWPGSSCMTMKEYPPSQTPGSFNLSKIEEKLKQAR